jgi:hypothetical protein
MDKPGQCLPNEDKTVEVMIDLHSFVPVLAEIHKYITMRLQVPSPIIIVPCRFKPMHLEYGRYMGR